jgi:hypothetical protein
VKLRENMAPSPNQTQGDEQQEIEQVKTPITRRKKNRRAADQLHANRMD